MNEPYYSITCWAIRLSPILLMGIAWLVGHYRYWGWKTVLVTLAVGYITGVASVWAYWNFAGTYAPTAEIADEILTKDGAPQLFAPFVMPIFVVIYFALMWPPAWIVTRLIPRKKPKPTIDKRDEFSTLETNH